MLLLLLLYPPMIIGDIIIVFFCFAFVNDDEDKDIKVVFFSRWPSFYANIGLGTYLLSSIAFM
jgi:hypothetical protein